MDLVPKIQVDTLHSRSIDKQDHDGHKRQSGLEKLPVELLRLICRELCLCSYCEPNFDPLDGSPLNPVQFRHDLNSLSRTCQYACPVAQPYVFHVLRDHDKYSALTLAMKLPVKIPHVIDQIRTITLNSIWVGRPLLQLLTGLRTLHVLEWGGHTDKFKSQLSFPCLRQICYGPSLDGDSFTAIQPEHRGLRDIMSAAENVTHLRYQRLFNKEGSWTGGPWKLPPCKTTTVEFYQCWLSGANIKMLMDKFYCLKNFKFDSMIYSRDRFGRLPAHPPGQPNRLADAKDGESLSHKKFPTYSMISEYSQYTSTLTVVESLRPSKRTLERLILEFGQEYEYRESFRSLPSMTNFTALRTMHVSLGALGSSWESGNKQTEALTRLLPESIEELFISEFDRGRARAVLNLGEMASAGAFQNLKHLRLIGDVVQAYRTEHWFLAMTSLRGHVYMEAGDDDGFDRARTELQPVAGDEKKEEEPKESDFRWEFLEWSSDEDQWAEVARHCLSDDVLMSSIASYVRYDSEMCLRTAFTSVPLAKRFRRLFSKTTVRFECVGVLVQNGPGKADTWDAVYL